MKILPLHSLVLMVGPNISENAEVAKMHFPPYEIISMADLAYELAGGTERLSLDDGVVVREAHRRAAVKLALGERVVIVGSNLIRKDRLAAIQIASSHGAPAYYIVVEKDANADEDNAPQQHDKMYDLFKANEREILYGDNLANVVDTRIEGLEVVAKFPVASAESALFWIQQRYNGICVVPDVHGMLQSLKQAVDWASRRNLFLVLLGDIIDYGPQSIDCVYLVYDLLMRGRAIMVIGNHERKIERWLDQQRKLLHDSHTVKGKSDIKLSEANRATTMVIEAMTKTERNIFENRFRAVLAHARHHWVLGSDFMVVHGAAEPEMFAIPGPRLQGKLESKALFGEIDSVNPTRSDGYPNRIYNWVNRIPAGKTVLVGHDIRNKVKPLLVEGELGGTAYFMDTGSGKGGRLTTADVMFKEGSLTVQNFTAH